VESVDDPQLSVTETAEQEVWQQVPLLPLPAVLVHPFTVVVMSYVPGVVTVMLDVAAPVFHSRVPAAVVDRVDDPQLFTTVTNGAQEPSWELLLRFQANWYIRFLLLLQYIFRVVTVMLEVVAPVFHSRLLQLLLTG
jgi:hypothetical protein